MIWVGKQTNLYWKGLSFHSNLKEAKKYYKGLEFSNNLYYLGMFGRIFRKERDMFKIRERSFGKTSDGEPKKLFEQNFSLYYRLPWSNASIGLRNELRYSILRSDTEKIVGYCNTQKEAEKICYMKNVDKALKILAGV